MQGLVFLIDGPGRGLTFSFSEFPKAFAVTIAGEDETNVHLYHRLYMTERGWLHTPFGAQPYGYHQTVKEPNARQCDH